MILVDEYVRLEVGASARALVNLVVPEKVAVPPTVVVVFEHTSDVTLTALAVTLVAVRAAPDKAAALKVPIVTACPASSVMSPLVAMTVGILTAIEAVVKCKPVVVIALVNVVGPVAVRALPRVMVPAPERVRRPELRKDPVNVGALVNVGTMLISPVAEYVAVPT